MVLVKALTATARAVCLDTAISLDMARAADEADRAAWAARAAFLTPVAKAFSTDIGNEVAYLGVQVHGGMGFIEETGAAQFVRDARIITIYEGTTGIQALDLIGRKILRDGGKELGVVMAEIQATIDTLQAEHPNLAELASALTDAHQHWNSTNEELVSRVMADIDLVGTASVNYLMLAGTVVGAWMLARSAIIANQPGDSDSPFFTTKIATAKFYAAHILPRAAAHAAAAKADSSLVMSLKEEHFSTS